MDDACQDYCESHSWDDGQVSNLVDFCESNSSPSCRGWSPGSYVSYSSSSDLYVVSWAFVASLTQGADQLWGCDAARVVKNSGDGFRIEDAASGDLLYELGLRDGDELISLNGYDLETFGDALFAYAILWEVQGETSYTLIVERGSNTVELDYYLAAT